jgi:disulfide bond formation protein DsbB
MTPLVQNVTTLLSVGIVIAQIFSVLVIIGVLWKFAAKYVLEIGLVISIGSILASLFYSNIAGFEPCEFCWWIRIMMYPQAILFAVALYYRKKQGHLDKVTVTVSLIMSVIGFGLALFQYYGQMFNPALLAGCVANGPSCTKLYFVSFGYITIPLMALTGFIVLIVTAIAHKKPTFFK